MSKEKGKTQNEKRKLTRQEKKQIDALIRQSKGDGKPHTAQDSIPFERMYKDGICRLANGRYSKCIEFEAVSYTHLSRFTIVATGIGAILVTRYISIMRPYTTSMIQIDNAFMVSPTKSD